MPAFNFSWLLRCGKRACGLAVLVAAGVWVGNARGELIFESATMGPPGFSGPSLFNTQFIGSRFYIDRQTAVTAVGGHILGTGTLFGAIVSLGGSTSLPTGHPFGSELLATTVFNAPTTSIDVRAPLSVTLAPGYYGLVFGSGLFGAAGSGMMVDDNQAIPGQNSPFWWGEYTTKTWGWNALTESPNHATRFVVEGTRVPEPSTMILACAATVTALGFVRRKQN
jgi:hypothetical protein